ncbi:hypothetical protein niasHS_003957 [Heterodera schachtii]|uniref:Uncharacterized protein n=1 Tax=Heterodera schachtii TaxID=97005 RepID=A0ABD2K4H1_HETSC
MDPHHEESDGFDENDDLAEELAQKNGKIDELEKENRNFGNYVRELQRRVSELEDKNRQLASGERFRELEEQNAQMKWENCNVLQESERVQQLNEQLKSENEQLLKDYNEVTGEFHNYKMAFSIGRTMSVDEASAEVKRPEEGRRVDKGIATTAVWMGIDASHCHEQCSSTRCSSDAEFCCWDMMFKVTAVFALVTLLVIILVHVPMLFI